MGPPPANSWGLGPIWGFKPPKNKSFFKIAPPSAITPQLRVFKIKKPHLVLISNSFFRGAHFGVKKKKLFPNLQIEKTKKPGARKPQPNNVLGGFPPPPQMGKQFKPKGKPVGGGWFLGEPIFNLFPRKQSQRPAKTGAPIPQKNQKTKVFFDFYETLKKKRKHLAGPNLPPKPPKKIVGGFVGGGGGFFCFHSSPVLPGPEKTKFSQAKRNN